MLINGKTPEQIKRGLRCGSVKDEFPNCTSDCAYYGKDVENDEYISHEYECYKVEEDTLAYIERLEQLLAVLGVSIPEEDKHD